jgi:hypothetical protein
VLRARDARTVVVGGASQLDLEIRILTDCDVYDALVSTRVYRAASSAEDALELVRKETGTAFDPPCVNGLIRVLGQNVATLRPEPAEPCPARARTLDETLGGSGQARSAPYSVLGGGALGWAENFVPASGFATLGA